MPFILHVLASLRGGGGRHVHALALGLQQRGVTVGLLAPDDDPGAGELLREAGMIWRPMALDGPPSPALFRALRKAYTELRPDVIHCHGHRAALWGRVALPQANGAETPRVVCTFHGYHPTHYRWPWNRALGHAAERMLLPRTDAFIAVSQECAESAAQGMDVPIESIHVIPNAIVCGGPASNDERIASRRRLHDAFDSATGFQNDPAACFTIGAVARLHRQKGIDLLLEAWQKLIAREKNFRFPGARDLRLAIAGGGPQQDEMEREIHAAGLSGSIAFLGPIPSARDFLAGLDLFVLPSRWEGMPLTVLEAWDAGVPVCATDVEGTRSLLHHDRDGFLVEPSVRDLRLGLALLCGDRVRRERFVREGARSLRQYSVDRMSNETLNVYRTVLEAARL